VDPTTRPQRTPTRRPQACPYYSISFHAHHVPVGPIHPHKKRNSVNRPPFLPLRFFLGDLSLWTHPRPVVASYFPHRIVCLLSGVGSFQNQKRGCAADWCAADVRQRFFFFSTANLFLLCTFPFIHLRLPRLTRSPSIISHITLYQSWRAHPRCD